MKIKIDSWLIDELFEENMRCDDAVALTNSVFFNFSKQDLHSVRNSIEKGTRPMDAYRKAALAKMNDEQKELYAAVQVGYCFESFSCLKAEDYTGLDYAKLLSSLPKQKGKRISFKTIDFPAYSLFVTEEVHIDEESYSFYSPLGYFDKDVSLPAIYEGDRVWMSLHPHEIASMKEPIEKARGNVLVYGFGLGYYIYEISKKENVSSVTVVENDFEVIEFAKKSLLPRFQNKDKIKIVQGDCLEFAKKHQGGYDVLFADIYHDVEDALPLYQKLLSLEGAAKENIYWIEKEILVYFRTHLITLLMEEREGYDESDYQDYSGPSDQMLCSLFRHLKNVELNTDEDVLALLSTDRMKAILRTLRIYEKQ